MERFVRRENIRRYRKLLRETDDEAERRHILMLLKEEEQKARADQLNGACVSGERPGGFNGRGRKWREFTDTVKAANPVRFSKTTTQCAPRWRKGWDSNPRGSVNPLAVFKTAALNRSATLPSLDNA